MTKLKLGPLADDRPVRIVAVLPAAVHRDLLAYAEAIARETSVSTIEPAKLVAPMLQRFMASDRSFAKARREDSARSGAGPAEKGKTPSAA